jgi:deoxyribodipyrimidine photo-lyase
MSTAIWWIRRDLRLGDNPALHTALQANQTVIPLFIMDEELLLRSSPRRNAFLMTALHHLEQELRSRGSRLVLRKGKPLEVLAGLYHEADVQNIYAQRDHSPFAIQRDEEIMRSLPLTLVEGQTIHPVDAVRKADGGWYQKFTPYSAAWRALPLNTAILPAPQRLPVCPSLPGEALPDPEKTLLELSSEQSAIQRLEEFCREDIFNYATLRDRMDLDRTSRLSIALKFGLLSPRQAYAADMQALENAQTAQERTSCQTWLGEIIWREFFVNILAHAPNVLTESFNPAYRHIQWDKNEKRMKAWQDGLTGYPVVDAAMRQLKQSGWMHNRARMITASFLVKDLHQNWQMGEEYFRRQLLDYDPAANNWQLAMGGRHWYRFGALFSHLQPGLAVAEIRPTGSLH